MASPSAEDRTPPQDVRDAAERALKWIEEGKAGKGFSETGQHRAEELAGGKAVPMEHIQKMQRYFARHEPDRDATGFTSGEDGFPSPGRVAWDAWGGDPGRRWSSKRRFQDDD